MKMLRSVYLLLLLSVQLAAQNPISLPRSTPEAEGVSSADISRFIDAADAARKNGLEFHSFMVLRHGKVVAEGWWDPYAAAIKHTMYSVSKSFTATAVGFAVAEKKLSLKDKVISFFPGQLPDTISPYLAQLTVKDLLTMSGGFEPEPTTKVIRQDDWVKAFLASPIVHEPGTKFLYNTAGTYMLSAIVQKVTGQKIFDYLQPRLFKPLGINGIDWETDPKGINTGGYGLRLKTEDMAKFGQLFLQKGVWRGKQLLPPGWVEEASTKKIEQEPGATQGRKDSSDWVQGYAYQMWRSRHNSYRGDGAYGQFILIWPEQDAVVITTAEVGNMQAEINLIFEYLLPAFHKEKLPADPAAFAALKKKTATLALPVPQAGSSDLQSQLSGKIFSFEKNDGGLAQAEINFTKSTCYLTLSYDTARYNISFGNKHWETGETNRYGPYLVAAAKGNRVGQTPFKVMGSYSWQDEKTLDLTLRYIESPHTETIRCVFEDDSLQLDFINLMNRKQEREKYKGKPAAASK